MLDAISTQMLSSQFFPKGTDQEAAPNNHFISSMTNIENQFLQITSELLANEYKKKHEGASHKSEHKIN